MNKNRVSGLCHELVQLEREFFFGTEDEQRWMPEFQKEYSAIMCPPFMGEKYKRKGLLLLGINPGVGKSNNLNQGDELALKAGYEFNINKKDPLAYCRKILMTYIYLSKLKSS